jgi:hypothetical protein
MTTNKRAQNSVKPEYEPTAQELSVLSKHFSGKIDQTAPRIKVLKGGKDILPDHPHKLIGYALLMEAVGTTDLDFIQGLVQQLANAGSGRDQIDEGDVNFMLSVVKDIKPRDQIEAMLAAQMAAVHMATMKFARQLALVGTIQEQDSAERTLNKLARTFATQMETLKRYRAGVEQKVTVQQVSVSEGGQAIVGNVTQAPRDTGQEKVATSPPALTDAQIAQMPLIDKQERAPVALPRGQKDDEQSST